MPSPWDVAESSLARDWQGHCSPWPDCCRVLGWWYSEVLNLRLQVSWAVPLCCQHTIKSDNQALVSWQPGCS